MNFVSTTDTPNQIDELWSFCWQCEWHEKSPPGPMTTDALTSTHTHTRSRKESESEKMKIIHPKDYTGTTNTRFVCSSAELHGQSVIIVVARERVFYTLWMFVRLIWTSAVWVSPNNIDCQLYLLYFARYIIIQTQNAKRWKRRRRRRRRRRHWDRKVSLLRYSWRYEFEIFRCCFLCVSFSPFRSLSTPHMPGGIVDAF